MKPHKLNPRPRRVKSWEELCSLGTPAGHLFEDSWETRPDLKSAIIIPEGVHGRADTTVLMDEIDEALFNRKKEEAIYQRAQNTIFAIWEM